MGHAKVWCSGIKPQRKRWVLCCPHVLKNISVPEPDVGESTTSLGRLFQRFIVLTVKYFYSCIQSGHPLVQLVPIASCLFHLSPGKKGVCHLHLLLFRCWNIVMVSSRSLLSSWLNKHSSLSLSSYGRLSSPLIVPVWAFFSLPTPLWDSGDQNWMQCSRCGLTSAEWDN